MGSVYCDTIISRFDDISADFNKFQHELQASIKSLSKMVDQLGTCVCEFEKRTSCSSDESLNQGQAAHQLRLGMFDGLPSGPVAPTAKEAYEQPFTVAPRPHSKSEGPVRNTCGSPVEGESLHIMPDDSNCKRKAYKRRQIKKQREREDRHFGHRGKRIRELDNRQTNDHT